MAALMVVSILVASMQVACAGEEGNTLSDEPFAPFDSRSFKPSLVSYGDLMSIDPHIGDDDVWIDGERFSVYYHARIVEVVLIGDSDQDGTADSYMYRAALFGDEDEIVALLGVSGDEQVPLAAKNEPPRFKVGDFVEFKGLSAPQLLTYTSLIEGNPKIGNLSEQDQDAFFAETSEDGSQYSIPAIGYTNIARLTMMHAPEAIAYCSREECESIPPTATIASTPDPELVPTSTSKESIARYVATVEAGKQAVEYNAFLAARRDAYPEFERYTESLRQIDRNAYELEERIRRAQQAQLFTYRPSEDELQSVKEEMQAAAKSIVEDVRFWATRVVDTCERLTSMQDLYEKSADDFMIGDDAKAIYAQSSYANNSAVYREFHTLCTGGSGFGKTFIAFLQDFSEVVDISDIYKVARR